MIESGAFGHQIDTMLRQDFSESRRITLERHESRSLLTQLLEKVVNLFGWFL